MKPPKVLHIVSNASEFFHDYPFYHYLFKKNEFFESVIFNVVTVKKKNDKMPFPVFKYDASSINEISEVISNEKPDILHCHSIWLLEGALKESEKYNIPMCFSFYRNTWSEVSKNLSKHKKTLSNTKNIFVPGRQIMEVLHGQEINVPMTIVKEVLDSTYVFKKAYSYKERPVMTFAVLISEFNKDYINNVHTGLEKILMTGKELNVAWICFEKDVQAAIEEDVKNRSLGKYVSIIDLKNFPLLEYEGLIADGNKNQAYSLSQYLHLLFSCMSNGKFLIVKEEKGLEDILINEVNCIVLPEYSSSKLGHLIHFFINFQDEMYKVMSDAMNFMEENHSLQTNMKKCVDSYISFSSRE
ncbi:MAG: hypothetical protein ACD_79C00484G0004 [uncultured bacterium]|nr:MAG: hypothetical protein ACD_79C00484G0004 [uncultured bacterium]